MEQSPPQDAVFSVPQLLAQTYDATLSSEDRKAAQATLSQHCKPQKDMRLPINREHHPVMFGEDVQAEQSRNGRHPPFIDRVIGAKEGWKNPYRNATPVHRGLDHTQPAPSRQPQAAADRQPNQSDSDFIIRQRVQHALQDAIAGNQLKLAAELQAWLDKPRTPNDLSYPDSALDILRQIEFHGRLNDPGSRETVAVLRAKLQKMKDEQEGDHNSTPSNQSTQHVEDVSAYQAEPSSSEGIIHGEVPSDEDELVNHDDEEVGHHSPSGEPIQLAQHPTEVELAQQAWDNLTRVEKTIYPRIGRAVDKVVDVYRHRKATPIPLHRIRAIGRTVTRPIAQPAVAAAQQAVRIISTEALRDEKVHENSPPPPVVSPELHVQVQPAIRKPNPLMRVIGESGQKLLEKRLALESTQRTIREQVIQLRPATQQQDVHHDLADLPSELTEGEDQALREKYTEAQQALEKAREMYKGIKTNSISQIQDTVDQVRTRLYDAQVNAFEAWKATPEGKNALILLETANKQRGGNFGNLKLSVDPKLIQIINDLSLADRQIGNNGFDTSGEARAEYDKLRRVVEQIFDIQVLDSRLVGENLDQVINEYHIDPQFYGVKANKGEASTIWWGKPLTRLYPEKVIVEGVDRAGYVLNNETISTFIGSDAPKIVCYLDENGSVAQAQAQALTAKVVQPAIKIVDSTPLVGQGDRESDAQLLSVTGTQEFRATEDQIDSRQVTQVLSNSGTSPGEGPEEPMPPDEPIQTGEMLVAGPEHDKSYEELLLALDKAQKEWYLKELYITNTKSQSDAVLEKCIEAKKNYVQVQKQVLGKWAEMNAASLTNEENQFIASLLTEPQKSESPGIFAAYFFGNIVSAREADFQQENNPVNQQRYDEIKQLFVKLTKQNVIDRSILVRGRRLSELPAYATQHMQHHLASRVKIDEVNLDDSRYQIVLVNKIGYASLKDLPGSGLPPVITVDTIDDPQEMTPPERFADQKQPRSA